MSDVGFRDRWKWWSQDFLLACMGCHSYTWLIIEHDGTEYSNLQRWSSLTLWPPYVCIFMKWTLTYWKQETHPHNLRSPVMLSGDYWPIPLVMVLYWLALRTKCYTIWVWMTRFASCFSSLVQMTPFIEESKHIIPKSMIQRWLFEL